MSVETALGRRSLAELVATLPRASMVFRRFGFDFCCHLDMPLERAAMAHGVPLAPLEAALGALAPAAMPPSAFGPLLRHIVEECHAVHRRELPALIALAATVETRRLGHPARPFGLADALRELEEVLEAQMRREEEVLFPDLGHGDPAAMQTFAMLHRGHEELATYLCCIETLTDGHRPPADACADWRRLYAGTAKLVDDLVRHRHLEDGRLARVWRGQDAVFPRRPH